MSEEKSPMDYKPLTRKELTVLTLERMREETITGIVRNDILIDTLKADKAKGGLNSELRAKTQKAIQNLETKSIQLDDDLQLIKRKLGEAKK